MEPFDESKHLRGQPGNPGQFRGRVDDAPNGSLGPPAVGPLKVRILDEADPVGGYDTRVDAPTGRHFMRSGVAHREDGPAYEGRDGTEVWYRNGKVHRDPSDGPAVIVHDEDVSYEAFYQDGQLIQP